MTQLDFLTAPHNGSPTSRAAAEAITLTAGTLRALVMTYIRDQGEHGATRQEIEDALQISGDTIRPRCKELLAMGLIHATTATRPTVAGRSAVVLEAT